MNRRFVIIICFLYSIYSTDIFSQKGHQFQIGADLGGYFSPALVLLKSQSMSSDPQLRYKSSSIMTTYGGRISLQYIGKNPSFITFGVVAELGQGLLNMDIDNIDLTASGVGNYKKSISATIFQNSLLIQATPHLGQYGQLPVFFELGIQFNSFTNVKESNSIDRAEFYIKTPGYQLKDQYQPNAKSLLAGAGIEFAFLRLGIRAGFPLDKITKPGYLPVNDGVYNSSALNPDFANRYQNVSGLKMTIIQLTLQIHFLPVAAGRCDLGKKGFQIFPMKFRKSYFWKMTNF